MSFLSFVEKKLPFLKLSFKKYLKYKCLNYRIVCLGSYCLPRVITTMAKLKAPRKYGELSCPFDLAFHNDLKSIFKIIERDFDGYFDDLTYDETNKVYVNSSLNAVYNHDGLLTRNEFEARYCKRIDNFRKYLKSRCHVVFVTAVFTEFSGEDIECFYRQLSAKRKKGSFSWVVINHNEHLLESHRSDVLIINRKFDLGKDWLFLLNKTDEGKKFYQDIVKPLKKFIKERTKFKIL